MTSTAKKFDDIHSDDSAMNTNEHKEKLSGILQDIFSPNSPYSTIGTLIDRLDHHGMAVILILFSIPSALPIPAAGYSTLLSIPLLLIGFRIIQGRQTIWLPQKIRNRAFQPSKFSKFVNKILRIVTFIERFTKPRGVKLVRSYGVHLGLGILICLLGLSMALPIPGTNTLPAGGIFLIGFALLEDDGLLLVGGIAYSIVALCLTCAIIFLGYEVVKYGLTSILS